MLVLRSIVGIVLNVAIFGVTLFLPARTWDWWRAWVLLGLVFLGTAGSTISLARADRGLLEERLKPPLQKGQPVADKIVLILLLATFAGLMVFIPLDVFRFHLIRAPGGFVSSLGLMLFVGGWGIASLALMENAFAAPVVKHQAERRHVVIDSGVYSVVRHPMYSGGMLVMIGMPLWLQSYAAALLAALPIATLAVRIVFEERFLRRELNGYEEYAARVRYRLIPFAW